MGLNNALDIRRNLHWNNENIWLELTQVYQRTKCADRLFSDSSSLWFSLKLSKKAIKLLLILVWTSLIINKVVFRNILNLLFSGSRVESQTRSSRLNADNLDLKHLQVKGCGLLDSLTRDSTILEGDLFCFVND